MASNAYVIFCLTANVRFRRGAEVPLDDLSGQGHNLLHEMATQIERLVHAGVSTISRYEQAFEFRRWEGRDGTLLMDGALGAYGTAGNTVNVDTNARRAFGTRDANMIDVRSLLALAPGAKEALLVCERRAGRHLKQVLEGAVLGPIGSHHHLTFNVANHVDLDAWRGYLDNATAHKVSAIWRSTRREDFNPDSRKMPELKMTAEGPLAERFGREALRAARRKAAGEPQESIRITDLTPRDTQHYADPRYEVGVTDAAGTQRTVLIEREQLPQWVYETDSGRRLPRSVAQHTYAEHAGSILRSEVGATLSEAWGTGTWSRELEAQVRAGADEQTSRPRATRARPSGS